jgi:predicted enzyme related to lactoylglutathione lyase
MAHPVIHAEIRSADPDATRAFFSELFGWTYTDGAFPGYSFVDTGVDGAIPTAIGPLQGGADTVLFFVGVQDVAATLAKSRATRRENDSAGSGSARGDVRRFR